MIMLIMSIFFTNSAYAAQTEALSPQMQADILKNVKDYRNLLDYLESKGIVKTADDFLSIIKNNKSLIKQLKPTLVDYGFSTNIYAEVFKEAQDYGIFLISADYGQKEVQSWSVYVTIFNKSDKPITVSKEIFSLVPKDIPNDQALYVISIDADAMQDSTNLQYLDEITINPYHERNLLIDFYAPVMTLMDNINLRVYDGKDHVDIHITK